MTKGYQKILLATDLGPQSYYIGQKARALVSPAQGELMFLHVIEPPMTYTSDFSKIEQELDAKYQSAEKSLSALALQLKIEPKKIALSVGQPQNEICDVAKEWRCDLIVVGSHGIGGYSHGLGSTAHSLLSQSPCDVLVVQVIHMKDAIAKATLPPQLFLWEFDKPNVALKKAADNTTNPKLSGSQHGYGEVVKRGPRPTFRPGKFPYKGGTRFRSSEDENSR